MGLFETPHAGIALLFAREVTGQVLITMQFATGVAPLETVITATDTTTAFDHIPWTWFANIVRFELDLQRITAGHSAFTAL